MEKKIKIRYSVEIIGEDESGEDFRLILEPKSVIRIEKINPKMFVKKMLKVRILSNVGNYKAGEELEVEEFYAKSWQDRGLALILKKQDKDKTKAPASQPRKAKGTRDGPG